MADPEIENVDTDVATENEKAENGETAETVNKHDDALAEEAEGEQGAIKSPNVVVTTSGKNNVFDNDVEPSPTAEGSIKTTFTEPSNESNSSNNKPSTPTKPALEPPSSDSTNAKKSGTSTPTTSTPPPHPRRMSDSGQKPKPLPSGLLQATLASLELDPSSPNFAFGRVLHSYPVLSKQVEHGLGQCKTITEYLTRVCKAKQTYSHEISRITQSALPKEAFKKYDSASGGGTVHHMPNSPSLSHHHINGHQSNPSFDAGLLPTITPAQLLAADEIEGAKRFNEAWTAIRTHFNAEGKNELSWAANILQQVVAPLQIFYRDFESKRQKIEEHYAMMTQQSKATQDQLLKNKVMVIKLIEAQKACEEKEKAEAEEKKKAEAQGTVRELEAKQQREAIKAKVSSFTSLFKTKEKKEVEQQLGGSSSELRSKAVAATQVYQQTVEMANERQLQYYTSDLPHICAELQKIEHARLEALKIHLDYLATHITTVEKPQHDLAESLRNVINYLNTPADIEEFTQSIVDSVGAFVLPNNFVYDLPFTLEDVKENRVKNLYGPPQPPAATSAPSMFGVSLAACMRFQAKSHPTAAVPIVLTQCIDVIRQHGLSKPDVLRNSADTDEILRVRFKLEKGEDIPTDNLEIASGLLKMWLRDLSPSLIPSNLYYSAVEAGKNSGAKNNSEAVQAIYNGLPILSQLVVKELAALAQDITEHEKENGMNLQAIATILAPNILRNKSQDPAAVLANINYEIKFTEDLLRFAVKPIEASQKVSPKLSPPSTIDRSESPAVVRADDADDTDEGPVPVPTSGSTSTDVDSESDVAPSETTNSNSGEPESS